MLTTRAAFRQGPVPEGKLALWILVAGVKHLAFSGAFFHKLALAAFRANYASVKGFGMATVRIAGAGDKTAARMAFFDDQVSAAFRAYACLFIFLGFFFAQTVIALVVFFKV